MLKSDYTGQDCSVARTLEVVGERWTLLIVRELMMRESGRFAELQQTLGVAKNILASRLEKLIARGIIEKVQIKGTRDWGEYRLTPKGRDLFPVISALIAWGDRYVSPDGPPLVLLHKTCGNAAGHKLVCECCGEPFVLDDLYPAT